MSTAIKMDLPNGTFASHLIDLPPTDVTFTKEELMHYLKEMYTMRRMEITCDTEYKARNIRGFCHLYDGQEAVAMGMQSALKAEDSWITSYRCHCIAYLRGCSVEEVIAELLGFDNGATKGKGGSMHFYRKKHNFFGGQGIVGAQVPVGAGLAFAAKYNSADPNNMPIAVAGYGDGAANQGQIWESANMAKLWGLPLLLVIENNRYGMGTSTSRHSCNDKYYTTGGTVIPGIRINGMNVLSVKRGFEYARAYASSGKGPMYVELDTYRYHGHSMSDPGTTYRTRDEVSSIRDAKDPIEYVKKLLVEVHNLATADEVKEVEKQVRNDVAEALKKAKSGKPPAVKEAYTEVYVAQDGKTQEYPPFLRLPDYAKSLIH